MPSTAPNSARTAPALELRQHLALVLLSREVGQRIPTVQDLQTTAQVGTGTVIKALRSLENSGAVSLSSHGHQGTVVSQRNVGILWNEAQLGNFVLATPPPGPVEQYGIVEAIQATLNRMNIPVSIAYIPGARERLAAVFHSRAHAVVTSITIAKIFRVSTESTWANRAFTPKTRSWLWRCRTLCTRHHSLLGLTEGPSITRSLLSKNSLQFRILWWIADLCRLPRRSLLVAWTPRCGIRCRPLFRRSSRGCAFGRSEIRPEPNLKPFPERC
jgi:hypothetical protein